MSDEFTTCVRCSESAGATSSKTGEPVAPMAMPVDNRYWRGIRSQVCEGCWGEWKDMEVKVINEYRLNLLEKEHRDMLKKTMRDFLGLDGEVKAPEAVAANWKPADG